jgi:hypothetical protein
MSPEGPRVCSLLPLLPLLPLLLLLLTNNPFIRGHLADDPRPLCSNVNAPQRPIFFFFPAHHMMARGCDWVVWSVVCGCIRAVLGRLSLSRM